MPIGRSDRLRVVAEGPGGLDEEEAHRHVGNGREHIGQPQQFQVALQRRDRFRFRCERIGGFAARCECARRLRHPRNLADSKPIRHYRFYTRSGSCSMNCFASRPAWSGLSIYG